MSSDVLGGSPTKSWESRALPRCCNGAHGCPSASVVFVVSLFGWCPQGWVRSFMTWGSRADPLFSAPFSPALVSVGFSHSHPCPANAFNSDPRATKQPACFNQEMASEMVL